MTHDTLQRTDHAPLGANASTFAFPATLAPATAETDEEPAAAGFVLCRRALGLAVGSLILAGCFSLLVVVGRLPGISEWIGDPQFFKRCLVVHVDLALIVWFFAFAAALFALLPGDRASHTAFRAGFLIAVAGVAGMAGGALVRGTTPVLANYVPVIDHPLFVGGLGLFLGGLLVCFLNGRLFNASPSAPLALYGDSTTEPREGFQITPEVAAGLKTVALAYLVAMTVLAGSWLGTPPRLEARAYYESLFWGAGHVLQVANVAAMLAAWLLLIGSLLNRPIVRARTAWVLFGLLLAPHLLSPLLTIGGTTTATYRLGFTRLMQFGIFPVVTILLVLCVRQLARAFRNGELDRAARRDPRFIGFGLSGALTVAGFVMGAGIRSSTTMIPAHYHASIGAVTAAFMAVTYLLLRPLGRPLPGARLRRLIPWQLYLFGLGQIIFALGFGWGGVHGLGRKAYGAEQQIRSAGELIGLGVMGLGGLIAIAGGLLFLALVMRAGLPRWSPDFSKLTKMKLNPLTGTRL